MRPRYISQLARCLCHYNIYLWFIPIELSSNKRFNAIFLQLLIILVGLSILQPQICFAESSINDNPHHFQQSCNSCHELIDKTDITDNKTVGPLYLDINRACSQLCHNYESSLNHPLGVKPLGDIPPQMPLNDEGQITCLTCHDELNNSSNGFPSYLRFAPDRELCALCHQNTGSNPKERSHWQFTNKAHLHINNPKSSNEDYVETAGNIDIESYTCLSCHDDKTAVVPVENETAVQKMKRWRNMSDHPIGMTYTTTAHRNSYSYNQPFTIDSRIRFFNGRMGCGSCHNLYNNEKKHLSLPYKRGVLCRECHIK